MNRQLVFFLVSLLAGLFTSTAEKTGRRGCFTDHLSQDPGWTGKQHVLDLTTVESCKKLCQGFKFAGLENGIYCMCGNEEPPTLICDSWCDSPCAGNKTQTCGGYQKLEVFTVELNPDVGCFQDRKDRSWKNCFPGDYIPVEGLGIYKLYTEGKTWHEALKQCEDDDAHLLIINSEDEADFTRSQFEYVPSAMHMHAGFNDRRFRGFYVTIYGWPIFITGYCIWSPEYPKNPTLEEYHCGAVDTFARLAQIDGNCNSKAPFVCEKKSESADRNVVPIEYALRAGQSQLHELEMLEKLEGLKGLEELEGLEGMNGLEGLENC